MHTGKTADSACQSMEEQTMAKSVSWTKKAEILLPFFACCKGIRAS